MARIRTIKPEFFTSEDIVSLEPLARLLYIALWCEADREGRLLWKPRTFKMRYLPADDCDVEAICSQLVAAQLVKLYGDGCAWIPKFGQHQHLNPRESVSALPEPPTFDPPPPKRISADVRSEVMDRDGRKCVRCTSTEDLTLDHILPQCIGGPHVAANLRVMCRACNAARPVSGQGLTDDLAKDGLTIAGLRETLGIDASRRVATRGNQGVHAQGGREGEGRSDAPTPDEVDAAAPPTILLPLNDGTEHPVSSAMVSEWSASFPAVDVPQALRTMRAWLVAKPARRKTARGVNAFVVGWLGREQDSGKTGRMNGSRHGGDELPFDTSEVR